MEAMLGRYLCRKPVSPMAKKSSTKGEHGKDLDQKPEVDEGIDDTDESDSDFEDEPVPHAIEVLVLSFIYFFWGGGSVGVGLNAIVYCFDNSVDLCMLAA